jgi:hypothetical protein
VGSSGEIIVGKRERERFDDVNFLLRLFIKKPCPSTKNILPEGNFEIKEKEGPLLAQTGKGLLGFHPPRPIGLRRTGFLHSANP